MSVGAVVVGRNLHVVEREIALSPSFAPSLYHQRERAGIFLGVPHVGLALIPNGTSHCIASKRRYHCVVETGRGHFAQIGGANRALEKFHCLNVEFVEFSFR